VVIIGSGPLPISLIMMCHQYGVRGIGIEQETERAELSRKVLEKLGFSDQIRIITGNHSILRIHFKLEGNWHHFKSKSNTTSRLVIIPRLI